MRSVEKRPIRGVALWERVLPKGYPWENKINPLENPSDDQQNSRRRIRVNLSIAGHSYFSLALKSPNGRMGQKCRLRHPDEVSLCRDNSQLNF